MKKEENLEQWDLKKIVITLFFVIVGILVVLELKNMFFPNVQILGDSTKATSAQVQKLDIHPPVNVASQVNSKIDEIKENVSSLNAAEIASSSPQVQKVLRDIQGIKDLPADQAKQACLKICSGL